MYYPLVGERVWVSGCRNEFLVASIDGTACVATISSASAGPDQHFVPFHLLFAYEDFEEAQAGPASPRVVADVLRTSRLSIRQGRTFIRELRESIRTTLVSIRQSQVLIAESDRVIARGQMVDGNHIEKPGPDQDGSEWPVVQGP